MSRQTAIQTTGGNAVQVNSCACEPTKAAHVEAQGWSYRPLIDVMQFPGEYTISLDAPGIASGEVELKYEGGVLTMHAPVRQRVPQQARFVRQEYGIGDFDRRIPLGRIAEFVDYDAISAAYEHGVLSVRLLKLTRGHARKIDVKTSN